MKESETKSSMSKPTGDSVESNLLLRVLFSAFLILPAFWFLTSEIVIPLQWKENIDLRLYNELLADSLYFEARSLKASFDSLRNINEDFERETDRFIGEMQQLIGDSLHLDSAYKSLLGDLATLRENLGFSQTEKQHFEDLLQSIRINVPPLPKPPGPRPQVPVKLTKGWNLVPFLGSRRLDVEEAFTSIRSILLIVKNAEGQIYYPDYGIKSFDALEPGFAYKVNVKRDTVLMFSR